MRVKKQPTGAKKVNTKPESDVPKEVVEEFKKATKRFLFNVDQIEQKYCRSSSGLVLNFDTGEYEFDEDLCTAENDEEMMKMIKRQKKNMDSRFGSALLSAPAPDPEEKDPKMLERWGALNQSFDDACSSKSNEMDKKKWALVKPGSMPIAAVSGPKQIKLEQIDVSKIDMKMIERYHAMGRLLGKSDLEIVKKAVNSSPQWALVCSRQKPMEILDQRPARARKSIDDKKSARARKSITDK